MRDLDWSELKYVSGAGSSPTPPSCSCPSTPRNKGRGNNGFGNGSDAPNLAAPGGSGTSPGDKDFSLIR